jgi:hypothetical protein
LRLQVGEIGGDRFRSSSARDSSFDTGCDDSGCDGRPVGDEAVVIGFFDPFVDDGTGPDSVHL